MTTATGEQYYVTHCGTADSILGTPGYSVRAASVSVEAHDSLQFALAFPPYELPIDLWKARPSRADAPRRLARTHHPDGGVWAVHSVYLEKDTMDRDRSYFSHLIHLPAADPATVLRSWGAAGWATESPRGSKSLPRAHVPAGTAISDDSLAAFLSDGPADGPTELSLAICPARLRAKPEERRAHVAQFLRAFALARAGAESRARLFVHAEPGLVALLLYAAVRLLPAEWTADLTFTTYEPPQRGIQEFRLASVVGTFQGVSGKGLEADLAAIRGYGLDTVLPGCSSPELRDPAPAGLDELLALAAARKWSLVEEVHRLIGTADDALARLGSSVPLVRALERFRRGEPDADDLLALRADPRGAELLSRAGEEAWPHLRAAAMIDARVRAAFRDWLSRPNRLDDLRREAAKALARGNTAGWDGRWTVIRDVADDGQRKQQVEKLLKNLDEHLPGLSLAARVRLRAACAGSGVAPPGALLAPRSLEELDSLLADGVPAAWQGQACLAVLEPADEPAGPMSERARQFLLAAPPAVLGAFARAVRPHLNLLLDLFRPYSPECRPRMDRLLRGGGLEPGGWLKLIQTLNLYTGDWDGYLLEGDRLTRLLVALGGDGAGRDVWKGYLDELSPALLSAPLAPPDADGVVVHAWERAVYAHLERAAAELTASGARLVAALPPGGAGKLLAARDLIRWVDDPGRAAKPAHLNEVALACQAYGISPLALLRAAYLKGGFGRLDLPRDAAVLEPFIVLFRACFPTDTDYRQASTALSNWIALSDDCPAGTRAAFQAHLVTVHIPPMWHQDLLGEPRHQPLLPAADARIREAQVVPPTVPEEESFLEEIEPVSGRKSKPRVLRRRRGTDAGIGVWVVVVVVVVAAAVGSVAAFRGLGGSRPDEVQPDRPPVKIEKVKTKK